MHLWEIEHAYYCNDGNFTLNGCLEQVGSFDAFMEIDGSNFGSDFDLNLMRELWAPISGPSAARLCAEVE